jgi:hypothetical protein
MGAEPAVPQATAPAATPQYKQNIEREIAEHRAALTPPVQTAEGSSGMNLSTELLDYIRFLGVQQGRYPDHHSDKSRGLMYNALEMYRARYVAEDSREEFYTIAMAAFTDGEAEGKKFHEAATGGNVPPQTAPAVMDAESAALCDFALQQQAEFADRDFYFTPLPPVTEDGIHDSALLFLKHRHDFSDDDEDAVESMKSFDFQEAVRSHAVFARTQVDAERKRVVDEITPKLAATFSDVSWLIQQLGNQQCLPRVDREEILERFDELESAIRKLEGNCER